jgi:hypothetical protein
MVIMKKMLLVVLLAIVSSGAASAQPTDIIGGPDGAQTVHHCGMLPVAPGDYTGSPVLTRIVQHKLTALGYLHGARDGYFGKADKLAVKHFQSDNGLAPSGAVGPETAQRLAYTTDPSPNVHRCFGVTADIR